jgi:hypothetical protein
VLGFPRVFLETNSTDVVRHPHLVFDVVLILLWWEVRGVPNNVVTTEPSTLASR